jgi:nucleoside-diphosphate-sugar epimerase
MDAGVETLRADRNDAAALEAALEGHRFDLTVDFLVYREQDVERLLLAPHASLGRYVMISTGQVYLVTEGAEPPFREDDAKGPAMAEPEAGTQDHVQWSYGIGKRRAERALFGLRATHGLRATALRLPILQGEGDATLRLWAWIERLLDGGPVLLPDGGERPVRHLDVADLAAAIVTLAGVEAPRHAAYNLAQPDVVTFRGFLERVAKAAGVRPKFVDASWDEIRSAGIDLAALPYAGRWASVLDPARAAGEWGFAGTPTDAWLPRAVRWHLEHRPARSHEGYAQRPRELELAARLGAGTR